VVLGNANGPAVPAAIDKDTTASSSREPENMIGKAESGAVDAQ
jgi:hypothetical protein